MTDSSALSGQAVFGLRSGGRAFALTIALSILGLSGAATADAKGLSGAYLAAKHAERRGDVAAAAKYYARALARDADNKAVLERAMTNHIAAGNLGDGIALARRYQEIEPGHHLGVLALAAYRLKTGDLDGVRTLLGEEGPFVGRVMAAWALFGDGDAAAARARLQSMEADDEHGRPGQILAAFHLGYIEAALGNDEAAVDAFTRATEMSDGGTLRLTAVHAAALARLGRKDEAVEVIRERLAGTFGNATLAALAEDIAAGADPEVDVRTAEQGAAEALFGVSGLLARGRSRLIGLAYARLATYLNPELTQAQLLIAQILDQGKQYDLAIAAYEAIPEDAEEGLGAQIGRAEVLQEAGRTDEAVEAMRATVDAFPESLEAHSALGDMLRRESRFEEASIAYDNAVKLLPSIDAQHWVLLYQRGITFERSKQWERAEADFRKALELQPDQPDVLNYLGYSLVELGRNLEEAEEMIEKAVEQRPEDGYIVDSLGWVLYRFGEFDRALEHLEKAVELRPVDPVINDHFGDALWMVGRRMEARFQWRRALSFEPTEKDATRIRRKLDEGLDAVLLEEKAEGLPGIIGRNSQPDATESNTNDGG